ncbi:MAG: PH domain-containing protein [Myxococcales bacterium]
MLSSRGRTALAPETFRPRAILRTAVVAADTLWIAVFVALCSLHGATVRAYWSAAFFIALFTACAVVYGRLAFIVADGGLIVRSVYAVRQIEFADILRVDVVPGPFGTSYAVRTRAGSVQFSSLFGGHERLCSLIVRRAGLV